MEHARFTSHGGFSVRSIFVLALTVIVTVFLWAALVSTPTHAASPAQWKGETILYDENIYNGPADTETAQALGLKTTDQVYVFVDPTAQSTNTSSNSSPPKTRKIHVIYFGTTELANASEASYKELDYVSRNSYRNPTAVSTISINQKTDSGGTSSCDVSDGLGWIICPVTNTLATAMDSVFDVLTGFLAVRPVETGQDNALYRAWKYMQAFANVAFVIGFLIIIYSQLTSIGLTNYGIKKLLPRLIVAALLVNISYFICSVAIDISNILGYSLQDIFTSMRNSLVGSEGNNWQDLLDWKSLAGFALSGGTAAIAGGAALFLTISDFGEGIIFLILPALVIALLAVLVALLVLAARQAIIVVLVILSPLAFVAYLLPNTEKWFEKWRDTFFTMLFLFPAFSVIFGGSQLAATAIIQTADSINLVILGMLVQVAPLVITPLLIKLGGSLLARIAGFVNNPNTGIIDRTRNWSKERAEDVKARRLGPDAKPHQLMKRNAQWRNTNRQSREFKRSTHTNMADARWANSPRYQKIDQLNRYASLEKTDGEELSEAIFDESRVSSPRVRNLDTKARATQDRLAAARSAAETQYEQNNDKKVLEQRIRARIEAQRLEDAKGVFNTQIDDWLGEAKVKRFKGVANIDTMRSTALAALKNTSAYSSRSANAKAKQQQLFAEQLQSEPGLAKLAGGILDGGETKALAAAKATIDHALEEAIKNIETTSDVVAGDIPNLLKELNKAVKNDDVASIVAYVNKLGDSRDAGFQALNSALEKYEAQGTIPDKSLTLLKQFVNASSTLNTGDESIGTWSRSPGKTLAEVIRDGDMWSRMTPAAWAGQKMSAQLKSLEQTKADGTPAISPAMAVRILQGPNADNVKGPVADRLKAMIRDDATARGMQIPDVAKEDEPL